MKKLMSLFLILGTLIFSFNFFNIHGADSYNIYYYDIDNNLLGNDYGPTFDVGFASAPVISGYRFDHWEDLASYTVFSQGDPITADTYVNAVYVQVFEISFNTNGGSSIANSIIDINNKVIAPADPTKIGKSLIGWYSDSDLTSLYDFDTLVTSAFTLYAKWGVAKHTLNFNTNGGSSISAINDDYNTVISAPLNPTKSYAIFDGWYSDSGFTTSFSFPHALIADKTIYAKWIENPYQYFYDSDLNLIHTLRYKIGQLIVEPSYSLPAYHQFLGWATTLGDYWDFSTDTVATNETDFYAVIQAQPYVYFYDGDTLLETLRIDDGSLIPKPDDPVKANYTFLRWETWLEYEWDFETDVLDEALTLFAIFEEYPLVYFNDRETGYLYAIYVAPNSLIPIQTEIPDKPVSPPDVSSNYKFLYWETELGVKWNFAVDKPVGEDFTLYSKYIYRFYDVTFNSNGGSSVNPIYDQLADELVYRPVDPTKAGLSFAGWYKDIDLKIPFNFSQTKMPYENLTLYAKWIKNIDDNLNTWADGTSLGNSLTGILISIVVIAVVIALLFFAGASNSLIMLVAITFIGVFVALKWIPIWIIIGVVIVLFGVIFFKIKGGGSND